MQVTLAFKVDRGVWSVSAIQMAQWTFSAMKLEFALVRTAPVAPSVTCVRRTSSISHQRDASKYY